MLRPRIGETPARGGALRLAQSNPVRPSQRNNGVCSSHGLARNVSGEPRAGGLSLLCWRWPLLVLPRVARLSSAHSTLGLRSQTKQPSRTHFSDPALVRLRYRQVPRCLTLKQSPSHLRRLPLLRPSPIYSADGSRPRRMHCSCSRRHAWVSCPA